MYGIILTFIKFNNFGSRHLNGPRRLFYSFSCNTRYIFEPLHVYEPGFNMNKYGNYILYLDLLQPIPGMWTVPCLLHNYNWNHKW